jgi:putative heme-binding domain-containing protein
VDILSAAKGGEGASEVFSAFLERKNGSALLAKALAGKTLPVDVARVGVRTARISGRESSVLVEALTKAAGLTFGARVLSPKELKEMVADASSKGDAARGEKVFRRPDQLCLKCHAIGGAGGQVGPDLSSIGASAQVDYLIESILQPSKAIKENYHSVLVSTSRGKQYTGIPVRKTQTALILRSDQDKEISIPLKDIEEQTPSKASLMPDGLTDTLTRGELVDLVRFLSELGKSERYSVGTVRRARRWRVLQPNQESSRLLADGKLAALASHGPSLSWEPVYSTVAGSLPLTDLARMKQAKDGPTLSVVRGQLDSSKASKVRLKLGSSKGLTLFLDGVSVPVKDTLELNLSPGLHTLMIAVDHGERTEPLQLEVEEIAGSAGVRFVAGK